MAKEREKFSGSSGAPVSLVKIKPRFRQRGPAAILCSA
jgi:hypothetical protein